MAPLPHLLLLLSLSSRALAQFQFESKAQHPFQQSNAQLRRRLDEDDSGTVPIPVQAHGAYCTAILGWYTTCDVPEPTDDGSFCDDTKYEPLDQPVFIDLETCFSNPNFDERSVSFFGETPDKKKIIEFHMIFETNVTEQYKGMNCLPNGVCQCSPALKVLKQQFLNAGSCDDTVDYSCLSEDFWGDTDDCFVPASLELTTTKIYCSMAAKVQQYGPCETELGIPDKAYDVYCTAITGWYDKCGETDPGGINDSLCYVDSFQSLEDPLFFDLDACYSNPYHNGQSLSFFGKTTDGAIKGFHMIFRKDGPDAYRPFSCEPTGKCTCPASINTLRDTFLAAGKCTSTDTYSCVSEDFQGTTERCFVPATINYGEADFYCSMNARIEQFLPCDKSLIGSADPAFAVTPKPVTATPPPVTTPAVTTPPPVTTPAVTTPSPVTTPAISPPTPPPAASAGGIQPTDLGGPPFFLAISSWWTNCTNPAAGATACSGTKTTPTGDGLIYINLEKCYSNPNMDGRSVSFYTAVDGDLVGYHLLFTSQMMYNENRPLDCDANGVCDCSEPTELSDLRWELKKKGACIDLAGLECTVLPSKAFTEECYAPMIEPIGDSATDVYCAMAATIAPVVPPGTDLSNLPVPTAGPTPNPIPTMLPPVPSVSAQTFDMAITSWWNGCSEKTGDHCSSNTEMDTKEGPIYIDFDSCYSNPYLDGRSVTFFAPTTEGAGAAAIQAFHILLTTNTTHDKYRPKSCIDGVCDCSPAALNDYRKQSIAKGSCVDLPGVKCFAQKSKGFTHPCYVPLLEEIDEKDGTDEFFCSMVASLAPVPRTGPGTPTTSTLAPEIPGEAEEPEAPKPGGTGATTPKASSAAKAKNSSIGTIFAAVFGTIIAVGTFFVVYFVFTKVHRSMREREAHDGNEHEEEVVWIRKGAHNPKFSTRAAAEADEGDGVWKKIDESDNQSAVSRSQWTIT